MAKIKKIQIPVGKGCIRKGFEVDDLPNLLVITGRNNMGKSTFMKILAPENKGGFKDKDAKREFLTAEGKKVEPTIVYIAAENILPSEKEAKFSTKTSALVKNLAELFASLGVELDLKGRDALSIHKDSLIELVNENLKAFTGSADHELELKLKDKKAKIDQATMIHLLIDKVGALEGGVYRDFVELGQGTQRVIITSILKAYADILNQPKKENQQISEPPESEEGQQEDEESEPELILILFEEPEIYLHPELKRKLNNALKKIAGEPNHQVIISTHDPYFAYSNMDAGSVKSFEKDEGGMTKLPEDGDSFAGVEDELLHINMFEKVLKELCDGKPGYLQGSPIDKALKSEYTKRTLEYEWDGKKQVQSLPLYVRNLIHHPSTMPKHADDEKAELIKDSIKILSTVLNKKL